MLLLQRVHPSPKNKQRGSFLGECMALFWNLENRPPIKKIFCLPNVLFWRRCSRIFKCSLIDAPDSIICGNGFEGRCQSCVIIFCKRVFNGRDTDCRNFWSCRWNELNDSLGKDILTSEERGRKYLRE